MLRFKSLGSGSSGNATLIEAGGLAPFRLLVDCGLGIRVLARRLAEAGLGLDDLDAIFITHEHGDHIGCAAQVVRQHHVPIWMSEGTWRGCGEPALNSWLRVTADGDRIDLGCMELCPFTVPHDALEPLQLSVADGQTQLGILTDLGHVPEHVLAHLKGCSALLLECNHDAQLLSESAYPGFLKQRVGGDMGHLSNRQAAEVAAHLKPHLRQVVAAHLSRQNNRPELAQAALSEVLGEHIEICVAHPASGTPWMRA